MQNENAEVFRSNVTDASVLELRDDRFQHWPFARRVADTIAHCADSSSIVLGVFAPWGTGKATVLNFIRKHLADQEHVVTVDFDP